MRIDEALLEAIERAYVVFGEYQRPTAWDCSPYKDGKAMLRALSSAPLRELTCDQIGPYAGSALFTVGALDDYKHFLPRILQECAVGCQVYMGLDPPSLAGRLVYGEWSKWPEKERAAIIAVFDIAWSRALSKNPQEGVDAADWLCGLAILGEPIDERLSDWLYAPTPTAILQAGCFLMNASSVFIGPREESGCWEPVCEAAWSQAFAWAFSEPVRLALIGAVKDAPADDRWILEKALAAISLSRH